MHWDYTFDVVVVGSGNGALTAALCSHDGGAKTLVIEKSDQFGGTSATSDNCLIDSIYLSNTSFDCANIGSNQLCSMH